MQMHVLYETKIDASGCLEVALQPSIEAGVQELVFLWKPSI